MKRGKRLTEPSEGHHSLWICHPDSWVSLRLNHLPVVLFFFVQAQKWSSLGQAWVLLDWSTCNQNRVPRSIFSSCSQSGFMLQVGFYPCHLPLDVFAVSSGHKTLAPVPAQRHLSCAHATKASLIPL